MEKVPTYLRTFLNKALNFNWKRTVTAGNLLSWGSTHFVNVLG